MTLFTNTLKALISYAFVGLHSSDSLPMNKTVCFLNVNVYKTNFLYRTERVIYNVTIDVMCK